MISRRRSVRIQKRTASESEASDFNTDDELTILTDTPRPRRSRKSLNTPTKSTVNKISKAERVPETVLELAEETDDTSNVSVSPTKKSRRKIEVNSDVPNEEDEDSIKLASPIKLSVTEECKKSTSPLKPIFKEYNVKSASPLEQSPKKKFTKLTSPLKPLFEKESVPSRKSPTKEPHSKNSASPLKLSPKKKFTKIASPFKPSEEETVSPHKSPVKEKNSKKSVSSLKKSPKKAHTAISPPEVSENDDEFIKIELSLDTTEDEDDHQATESISEIKDHVIKVPTKTTVKKSRFKVDLKKYECNINPNSSLLRLGLELKHSSIFQDHLYQIKNKGNSQRKTVVNDVCGLDGVQFEETDKDPRLQSDLITSVENAKSRIKAVSETTVKNLMKKSVLLPDMEKEKNCPVFNQSKNSKAKERKKKAEETAGPEWFNMPKTELTDEVKRDMQILKMRKVLDTKHHYKREDSKKFPKYFQMGTIVEGSHEFYSSRVTKKDRKRTMVDELLADSEFRKKNKKRMIAYEMKKGEGGKGFYKQKIHKRKPKM